MAPHSTLAARGIPGPGLFPQLRTYTSIVVFFSLVTFGLLLLRFRKKQRSVTAFHLYHSKAEQDEKLTRMAEGNRSDVAQDRIDDGPDPLAFEWPEVDLTQDPLSSVYSPITSAHLVAMIDARSQSQQQQRQQQQQQQQLPEDLGSQQQVDEGSRASFRRESTASEQLSAQQRASAVQFYENVQTGEKWRRKVVGFGDGPVDFTASDLPDPDSLVE